MSKKNWSNILSGLARTALAFAFVFGQTAWAGQSQNAKDKTGLNGNSKAKANASQGVGPAAKARAAEEETATAQAPSSEKNPSRGGQHEGIKVHGHWTIEVRNADGTLVTHREFENALTSSGGGELASYLARSSTVGQWNVGLVGASVLFIDEPGPAAGAPNPGTVIGTLTVSAPANGTLVLSGSGTAPLSTTITSVFSEPSACQPTLAPSACNVASGNQTGAALGSLPAFTSATLPSPVDVTAGQTIAVTVTISFS
jgi:hypothetical protein